VVLNDGPIAPGSISDMPSAASLAGAAEGEGKTTMATFEFDSEEIVQQPGGSQLTLRPRSSFCRLDLLRR
jgi:hypothetical protein